MSSPRSERGGRGGAALQLIEMGEVRRKREETKKGRWGEGTSRKPAAERAVRTAPLAVLSALFGGCPGVQLCL